MITTIFLRETEKCPDPHYNMWVVLSLIFDI